MKSIKQMSDNYFGCWKELRSTQSYPSTRLTLGRAYRCRNLTSYVCHTACCCTVCSNPWIIQQLVTVIVPFCELRGNGNNTAVAMKCGSGNITSAEEQTIVHCFYMILSCNDVCLEWHYINITVVDIEDSIFRHTKLAVCLSTVRMSCIYSVDVVRRIQEYFTYTNDRGQYYDGSKPGVVLNMYLWRDKTESLIQVPVALLWS